MYLNLLFSARKKEVYTYLKEGNRQAKGKGKQIEAVSEEITELLHFGVQAGKKECVSRTVAGRLRDPKE